MRPLGDKYALTPMEGCIRWQRCRERRRSPHRASAVIEFKVEVLDTKRQELGQRFGRVRIRNTFNKLMHGAHCVWSHVRARIVEDHVKYEIEEGVRKVNAYLAAGVGHGVN